LIDVEVSLVRLFHWNAHDIDETDITTMIRLFFALRDDARDGAGNSRPEKVVYCDQIPGF